MSGPWTTHDPDQYRRDTPTGRQYQLPGQAEPVRSVTSIKPPFQGKGKTPGGGRVPLDVLRAAEAVAETPARWADLHPDLIVEEVAQAPSAWLKKASQRGNDVHDRIHRHIQGDPITPGEGPDDNRGFLDGFLNFETEYGPEWVASEVVAVLPNYGLAGTIDAIARLNGQTVLIDWKTRTNGRHSAWPNEAAQLALYSLADTLVVGDGDTVLMPQVDGVAVVSLTDTGFQLWPLDLDHARDAGLNMLSAHQAIEDMHQAGQLAIRGTTPTPPPPPAQAEDEPPTMHQQRVAWVQGRVHELPTQAREDLLKRWPHGVPRKAAELATTEQVTRLAQALSVVEADHRLPFGPPDPAQPTVKPARRR